MDDDQEKGDGPKPDKGPAIYKKSLFFSSLEEKISCIPFHILFKTGT